MIRECSSQDAYRHHMREKEKLLWLLKYEQRKHFAERIIYRLGILDNNIQKYEQGVLLKRKFARRRRRVNPQ